jgi:hypothetical protein
LAGDENLAYPRRASAATTAAAEAGGTDTEDPHTGVLGKLKLPAHYGPHGKPPTDYFWSLHWEIPADFPTGSLGYKVIATMMDGTTQTWEPFTRAPTQLTVIAGEPEMKN